MRYVPVLEPIQLLNPTNGKPPVVADPDNPTGSPLEPTTMHRFLVMYVLSSQDLKGYKDYKIARTIDKLFQDAKPGEYVPLEDAHWERLKRSLESIAVMNGNYGAQLVPFMDAIADAKEKAPGKDS